MKNPNAFTTSAYLPPNVAFGDPSKMAEDNVELLITYWREQQSKGEIPFKFHHVKSKGVLKSAAYPTAPPEKSSATAAITGDKAAGKESPGKQESGNGKTKGKPKKTKRKAKKKTHAARKKRVGNADDSPHESLPGNLRESSEESERERPGAKEMKTPISNKKKKKSTLKSSNMGIPSPSANIEVPQNSNAESPGIDDTTPPPNILPKKHRRIMLTPTTDGNASEQTPVQGASRRAASKQAHGGHTEMPTVTPRAGKRTIRPPKTDDDVVSYTPRKSNKKR